MRLLLLSITFFLFFCGSLQADVYRAKADGFWNAPTTWWQGSVPGDQDTVIIDGFTVTVAGNALAKHLYMNDSLALDAANLIIDGSGKLTIGDDLEAISNNNEDLEIFITNGGELNIGRSVKFERTINDVSAKKLRLVLSEASQMNVSGMFIFGYTNSGPEGAVDIDLSDDAVLDITGSMALYVKGGKTLSIETLGNAQLLIGRNLLTDVTGGKGICLKAKDASLISVGGNVTAINSGGIDPLMFNAYNGTAQITIGGNLSMASTSAGKVIYAEASGSDNSMTIGGDLIMDATAAEDVYVELKSSSTLNLGGDINRTSTEKFGSLLMYTSSTLVLNGSGNQVLDNSDPAINGADKLNITNIAFNNPEGIEIMDTLFVTNNLTLQSGVITTDDNNLIVFEDDAEVSGGSETAYIDGPVIKRGRTSSGTFIFPLGDNGNYAPLEISGLADADYEYSAQFYGDPPPFGNNLDAAINNISSLQYWTLTPAGATPDAIVTLHWSDAAALGINDLGTLVVAGLDGTNVWLSNGNAATTGGTGSGVSGSVSAAVPGDPPPFGNQYFTIGSTGPLNSLPVELTKFAAVQQEDEVYLEWKTASEINTSHFVVERLEEGAEFVELSTVSSRGSSRSGQKYISYDTAPQQGLNYYRLKIVDEDGSYVYSHVEVVKFDSAPELNIFPNPVANILQVESSGFDDQAVGIEVYDRSGQLLFMDRATFENGRLQLNTDAINIHTTGTYFLRITDASGSRLLKFIKVE